MTLTMGLKSRVNSIKSATLKLTGLIRRQTVKVRMNDYGATMTSTQAYLSVPVADAWRISGGYLRLRSLRAGSKPLSWASLASVFQDNAQTRSEAHGAQCGAASKNGCCCCAVVAA